MLNLSVQPEVQTLVPPHFERDLAFYGSTGPQLGSEPSCGFCSLRMFTPVRSTCHRLDLPSLPRDVRKNCSTRPFGDQVGASSCQSLVSRRSPPPDGVITPMRNSPPPILVKAIKSPRGDH